MMNSPWAKDIESNQSLYLSVHPQDPVAPHLQVLRANLPNLSQALRTRLKFKADATPFPAVVAVTEKTMEPGLHRRKRPEASTVFDLLINYCYLQLNISTVILILHFAFLMTNLTI